ncbi:uncharacterized protein Bfra_003272 [Botrytis fragariae]|uniref:Uncharacterized protein n=1 Tax=Botrytis fragariae TaxID=1964551 RepID=A0A8H6AW20_9HELO|nr:uncharacterized protein Bfra_003272 [Botrytis fragariae]KAF5874823.1 hypothetical protein Bfra_003272 [Botrytis fragariae]
MSTSRSEEHVESTEATEMQDELKEAVNSSGDDSANIILRNTLHRSQEALVAADETDLYDPERLQTGSKTPVLDSGVRYYGYHWGSERPKNYNYLIYELQKERGSPPPSEELYESYKFAAATTNGNESSLFNAAKVFFKDWDNDNGNENGNYGQIVQEEFTIFGKRATEVDLKSPMPHLVEGFRDGRVYLEQLYESFDGAADMIRDERTRSSAFCHFAGEYAPSGTSFGCEAVRLRYIGAFLVAERRLAFHYLKKFSSSGEYYRCDKKDYASVITFIMSESRITLFAHFGRTGSNMEYNDGKYLEFHMSELLCLSPATSYETFREAWAILRNAQEYSKDQAVLIALEMEKSMQVAAWKAFNAEKKDVARGDSQSVLARRRIMAIEAWRSEEEMIQSRRNLDGVGPEDREAYFRLQEVRYD